MESHSLTIGQDGQLPGNAVGRFKEEEVLCLAYGI